MYSNGRFWLALVLLSNATLASLHAQSSVFESGTLPSVDVVTASSTMTSQDASVIDGSDSYFHDPASMGASSSKRFTPIQALTSDVPVWSAHYDQLFVKPNTTSGTVTDEIFGYRPALRLSAARVNADNFGLRFTWFAQSAESLDPVVLPATFSFKTYNLDFELTKSWRFGNSSSIEAQGGVRFNEFRGLFPSNGQDDYKGLGGLIGINARQGFRWGSLFAGAKWASLYGNAINTDFGGNAYNVVRTQQQLSLGYEHSIRMRNSWIMSPRLGMEFLNFAGYAPHPDDDDAIGTLGLVGFSFGLGLEY